ncbi:aminoglycoside phosphotransferase family protein [Saccharothrix violaceirubra]|uniref:Aminoglycoside phosphotransferase domain-containing protein n=1 Tax=Saccharothrix violaceirubra TaxID=413306 RepID=A0A7W7T7W4_9PSEU|nr:phosphotransferase [Saccharothrix violaceirubra]MBB4968140.1 hypothetical protein [Saccharothrix violaceirubra]
MTNALRAALSAARSAGLPTDDPIVLKNGSNLLVHLRPAPVVARVGTRTAFVRGDVTGHFGRADAISRYLAARGVPVVVPADVPGPVRQDGFVVAFASHVVHTPWEANEASFAALLRELHAELVDYPGDLPERGPLDDLDATLDLLGRPAALVAERDDLVARWPSSPVRPLHGDAHARNVLATTDGPVWNDFEDAWRGPAGWDVACAHLSPALFPDEDVAFWRALRDLFGRCWVASGELYRP